MNAIEESLRRALEGGNRADPAFRQSIYEASGRAMERMLGARGLDAESADAERARLAETIDRVEAEYAAYYNAEEETAHPAAEEPAGHEDDERWDDVDVRGAGEAGRAPGSYAPPPAPLPHEEGGHWRPGGDRSRPQARRRRGGGRRLAIVAAALLILVAALYALVLFVAPGQDAPQSEPQTTGEATDSAPTPSAPQEITWINVFSGDLEQLETPGGGRVAGVAGAEREAVRLSAPEEGESEILITLGPGLVGELTGSNVRVELVAGSPDSELREFSVRCVFGQSSVCDRQRFATSMREEAFVFDVAIPVDASTPASLAIAPGLSPEGRDVDLYSVRIRVL